MYSCAIMELMKKQFIKTTRGSVIAIIALAFLFIITQSVIAAGSSVSLGDIVKGRNARVEQFQLSPILNKSESLSGQTQLRVYGDTILSSTIINEEARFSGYYNSANPSDPLNSVSPLGVFNIGYNSISETPSLATFQVNGSIKVSDLSDTSLSDNYCLCANGYGELMRCGVYNPSIGKNCKDAL